MHDRTRPPSLPRGEEVICGLRAGIAAIRIRRNGVVRVACAREVESEVRGVAGAGLRIEIVGPTALATLAGSSHHEGLCVVARRSSGLTPVALEEMLARAPRIHVLALDGLANPHNLGAVLRTAAYFGVDAVVLDADAEKALTRAAVRVAEGGYEHVAIAKVGELAPWLARAKRRGALILGADAHAPRTIYEEEPPERCVVVLGHEQRGMRPDVKAVCDRTIAIPSAKGAPVESLNVSVAAGVLVAWLAYGR